MAKSLVEKFFIRPGHRLAVINAPENYLSGTLAELPAKVTVANVLDGQFDLIHYFVTQQETLVSDLDSLKAGLKQGGVVWICYPKGGDQAKLKTDLNRDKLWKMLEPLGLTPNHQISIDETWSALRFKLAE